MSTPDPATQSGLSTGDGAAGCGLPTRATPTDRSSLELAPIVIDECGPNNPAGLSAEDLNEVRAGGSPGLRWLHPRENTLFPSDTGAPELRWDGPPARVIYVHIQAKAFEYFGCLKPGVQGVLTLAQDVWDEAALRNGDGTDAFAIELTIIAHGAVVGPAVSHFLIADRQPSVCRPFAGSSH